MNKAIGRNILGEANAVIDRILDQENDGLILDQLVLHYEKMSAKNRYAYVIALAARVRVFCRCTNACTFCLSVRAVTSPPIN